MGGQKKKEGQDKKGWMYYVVYCAIRFYFTLIFFLSFAYIFNQIGIFDTLLAELPKESTYRQLLITFLDELSSPNTLLFNFFILFYLLFLEFSGRGFLKKVFGEKNVFIVSLVAIIVGNMFLFWFFGVWLKSKGNPAEAFSSLMSAFAFLGLIGTITVQIYTHRKGQEMELKKMRGEYIANHKRHTEIREEVLRKMREASNQGKYIEEIFSKRDEHHARVTIRTFEEELGLRNSSQIRSERKIS